jgi:hypothetical protein
MEFNKTSGDNASVCASNEVNKTIVCGASVLVFLIGVIYELHHGEDLRRHSIHIEIDEDWLGHSINVKFITLIF